jgi:hypothetical protein
MYDIDEIITKLDNVNIDLFKNFQSPKKFKVETLDKHLKPFFERDKAYYLYLENNLKKSNSNLEIIKKFLNELNLREKQMDLFKRSYISTISFINFINDTYNYNKKFSLCENRYKILKKKFKTFDKINHCYPLLYNPYLYINFFDFYCFSSKDNFFSVAKIKIETHYILVERMLNFLIKNEFYILDNIKFFLSRTNKNYSIKELLNYIANDDTIAVSYTHLTLPTIA